MQITVAENAGFCFGVRRATQTLERALEERVPGQRVVTLGHLIHNDMYRARMAQRGVETVEADELVGLVASASAASPVRLLVRAHGIPLETQNFLRQAAESGL